MLWEKPYCALQQYTLSKKNLGPKCSAEFLRLVFPIRGKILKSGFRVAEKSNPGKPIFSGFEINAILSDKTQYHCEITTVGPCTIYYRIIN